MFAPCFPDIEIPSWSVGHVELFDSSFVTSEQSLVLKLNTLKACFCMPKHYSVHALLIFPTYTPIRSL